MWAYFNVLYFPPIGMPSCLPAPTVERVFLPGLLFSPFWATWHLNRGKTSARWLKQVRDSFTNSRRLIANK